jgi:hypothetical protein
MINQLNRPPKLLQRLQRILIPQLLRLLPSHKHKIMLQQLGPLFNTILFCGSRVDGGEVHDEGLFDAEDGVGGFVGVVADV